MPLFLKKRIALKLNHTPVFLILATLATAMVAATPDEAVRSRIKREAVTSTNVASVGYSRHLRALEIEFTRGAIYRFLDVPSNVYRGLLAAESKGHFIAENIRGKYRFVRVRGPRDPVAETGTRPDS